MGRAIEGDVKLFLDLALWFGKKREMTVNKFLSWFSSYLSTDNKDYFKRIVPFFMEDQQRAEITLCELLERDYLQKKKIRTVGSKITRHVDWPKTYAKAIPYFPIKYHGVEIQTQLNISLLGALVGIAGEWKVWLERIVDWKSDTIWKESEEIKAIKKRAAKLTNAIEKAKKRGALAHSYALSAKHRQIILNFVTPENRESFLKSLNRWSDYSVKDLSSVMKKVERIILEMVNDDANLDNLFEATSHLSILKAATEPIDKGGRSWLFVSTEISDHKKTTYHLKHENINFKLGKGNPGKLFPESKHVDGQQSDRMLQLRELGGHSGSGYEPDIVMGFYRTGRERDVHVIFGDAKRYKQSDISGAYKSTIAPYMIAYGHWGKLEMKAVPSWEIAFRAPVMPFFTLFYMPKSGENNGGNELEPKPEPECSPIRTFTLKQMQSDPSCLDDWFAKISNNVKKGFDSNWSS